MGLCERDFPLTNTGLRVGAFVAVLSLFLLSLHSLQAQDPDEELIVGPDPTITAVPGNAADQTIQERIAGIYSQIDELTAVDVVVREGVVLLSGSVSNDAQAKRALDLANRIEGVVTVDDGIERTLDVHGNVAPFLERFRSDLGRWVGALPLLALALAIFLIVAYLGHRLAKWSALWRRLSPNPFLAELVAQAVRAAAILFALVVALNLIGATALLGTILGGAGVAGLAIGFAVRDSLENYVSSIMLSLRQPFRVNDHVVIDDHEGKVLRLTSRATVLMTLDGNHLRIPNSTVFKAVILNYTRNPERRFSFELGVDADDDPVAAMRIGLAAVSDLPFVLKDPAPSAIISAVGDSNIVINFMAWINQGHSDFGKARSLGIRAAKIVLEERGFTLPEPIYRLRFDQQQVKVITDAERATAPRATSRADDSNTWKKPVTPSDTDMDELMDVSPDTNLEKKVNDERALDDEGDLLDHERPVE